MDRTTAKKIQALFGQTVLTELKDVTSSSNLLPLYSGDTEPTTLNEDDLVLYLCKKTFMFLVGTRYEKTFINPRAYLVKLTKETQNERAIELGKWLTSSESWNETRNQVENYVGGTCWTGEPTSGPNITKEWFKHFQYQYFDSYENDLEDISSGRVRVRNCGGLPTMLLYYGTPTKDNEIADQNLNPRMWETNIPEVEWADVKLPNGIPGKKLFWKDSCVKDLYEGMTGHSEVPIFKRRNYCKIVNGVWSTSGTDSWSDEKGVIERNEEMGDIDRTLKSLTDFLDDFMGSIGTSPHKGKVTFSASKNQSPMGSSSWQNVVDIDDELDPDLEGVMVWTGSTMVKGENEVSINDLPKHHHNTLGSGRKISNISIIGRPEGETVGGVAKVETAEKVDNENKTTTSVEIPKDTEQNAALTMTVSVQNQSGAYTGTVIYNQLDIDATKKPHNNIPPYYKVRAFVYMGDEPDV